MNFLRALPFRSAALACVFYSTSLFLLISFTAKGQHQLIVEIRSIKSEEGNVAVALYNSESGFMKTPFLGKSAKAEMSTMEFVFDAVPAGSYAISVMHDANQNKKLDTRKSGIPTEGFGFSNNAISKIGVPKFEKAKIELAGDSKSQITLRYIEANRKKEIDP